MTPSALRIWRLLCDAFREGTNAAGANSGNRLEAVRLDDLAEGHATDVLNRHGDLVADRRMRLWLDCEFNGYGGELLSIALVDEYGRPFYEVLKIEAAPTQWVAEHVMPVLGEQAPVDRAEAARKLETFLAPYEAVHIVTDWPDDVRYFCELLLTGPGSRIATPPLTLEVLRVDAGSAVPHNALADANGLRRHCLERERERRDRESAIAFVLAGAPVGALPPYEQTR